MSLHKLFKNDVNLEKNGIWIDYGPNDDLAGTPPPSQRFRVARSGGSNMAYNKALEHITKPFKRALQNGQVSNERAKLMDREAFLDTCLLGWENVTNADGQLIEFSKANAVALFDELPDLYDDIREQANNASLYREEVREADLGNSGTSLSTDLNKDQ